MKKPLVLLALIAALAACGTIVLCRTSPLFVKKTAADPFKTFPHLAKTIQGIPQFEGDLSVQYLDAGIANNVFQVSNRTSGDSYTLTLFSTKNLEKVSKPYRFFEQIAPLLAEKEIRAPQTVLLPFQKEDRIVMVKKFLEGTHITDQNLLETAKVMAKLHTIHPPAECSRPRFDMDFFFKQCADWQYCADLKAIWDSLDFSYLSSLPTGIVHGDFSYSNVLVDKSNQISLIDFEKLRTDYLIEDIALAQIYYGFDEQANFKKELFASFMDAYQQIRPLSPIEKANLITHTKRCLIEIALVLQYYFYVNPSTTTPGVLGSPTAVKRIKTNPSCRFLDPDFMQAGIQSLVNLKGDAWHE